MKRVLVLMLALVLVLSLAACGDGGETTTEKESGKNGISFNFDEVSKGSTITFGSYDQDNYSSDGKTPISWIVLEKGEDSMTLLSVYALDCHAFDSDTTVWRDSSIRDWLNKDFLSTAFNDEESAYIATSKITTSGEESITTEDKVYLLSSDELNTYYPNERDAARLAQVTDYAVSQGLEAYDNKKKQNTCNWWLRDADPDTTYYSQWVGGQLLNPGEICSLGPYEKYGVRPVIVVNRES